MPTGLHHCPVLNKNGVRHSQEQSRSHDARDGPQRLFEFRRMRQRSHPAVEDVIAVVGHEQRVPRCPRPGGVAEGGELPAARALGVPQILAYIDGSKTLEAATVEAVAETRRYAKRQMTWFRHQMPDWRVIESSDPAEIAKIVRQELA